MMKNFRIKTLVLCSISIIMTLSITACSQKENKQATTNNQVTTQNNDQQTNNTDNTKETQNTSGVNNQNVPKFVKEEMPKGTAISFNTPWKSSEDGNYNACIEGRGEEALEEAVGKVMVKDNSGNVFSFKIADNEKITPRYIEWVDNGNLMVVIGATHGTVSKGGNLYLLNVNSGKASLLLQTPDKKQQVVSAKKSGSNISLKVNVYEDSNYNKSHMEDWIIYSFDINLKKQMEVKTSEGKLITTINKANQ